MLSCIITQVTEKHVSKDSEMLRIGLLHKGQWQNAEIQVLMIYEFSILQSGDIHSGWMDDVLLTGSSYNPYKESADKGNKRRAERQKKGKQNCNWSVSCDRKYHSSGGEDESVFPVETPDKSLSLCICCLSFNTSLL